MRHAIASLPIIFSIIIASSALVSGAEIPSDTLSHNLNEVTIVAPETVKKGNRTIYTPTKQLKSISNSAVQLLSGVQIPELIVNPTTGTVEMMGGGNLSIRINGRPASNIDLAAVDPKNITKVEYITNPGVRYGSANGVLDISVKRPPESGYSVFGNIMQSVNRGWGDYTAGAKYNVGKSEWSVDYKSNPMWNMKAFRDNEENIILENGLHINRMETGIKLPNRMVTHRGALQYSYAEGRKTLLNIQARLFRTNDLYQTMGDITTSVANRVVESKEYESQPLKSWQGDLDIYFHRELNKKHHIYINVVPSIVSSNSQRVYNQDIIESSATGIGIGNLGIDINNNIKSNGARLLAEGIWEGKIGCGTMSAGVRSNSSWTKADYTPVVQTIREEETTNYMFVQWKQLHKHWYYEIGTGFTLYNSKEPLSKHYAALNPRGLVKYSGPSNTSVTLYGESKTITPGVNDINPAIQQIDLFQYRHGNAGLKPYQQYIARLELESRIEPVSGKITVEDTYSDNPTMYAKFYENGVIMQEPFNHGYNNDFLVKGQLRMPVISSLNLSVEGGWHITRSKGLGYSHKYSQPFVNAQLMFIKGHLFALAKYNTTFNKLWGQSVVSTNQNLMILVAGYSYKSVTFMGGLVNPLGRVKLRSRDLSEIANYDRLYQATSSNKLFLVGVTFNFHSGKNRAASQKKLDNDKQYESISNAKK